MKPIDPDKVPQHVIARRHGKPLHGPAPELPREFVRARLNRDKQGRKGAKARAKMRRIIMRRFAK